MLYLLQGFLSSTPSRHPVEFPQPELVSVDVFAEHSGCLVFDSTHQLGECVVGISIDARDGPYGNILRLDRVDEEISNRHRHAGAERSEIAK